MGRNTYRLGTAAVVLLGLTGAALAENGEFDNMCTTGLAMHKQVKSDCSSRATWNGKTYCFGNQEAEVTFFKKGPDDMITKAEAYYKEIHKDAKN